MKWTALHKSEIAKHLLFWNMIWLFFVFFFSYNSGNITYVLAFASILTPITAAATYSMVYMLIPKYLNNKRYVLFSIYSFTTLLITAFLILLMLILAIGFFKEFIYNDLPPMSRNYIYLTILVYLIVALVSFASVWQKNMQVKITNGKLEQQLLATQFKAKEQELINLKNQIHPHFLFNMLNTIYGLSLKQSPKTPDIIIKLSDLLDYILYQASKEVVLLVDEIKHIEQYIDLEKIRFNDSLEVNFKKNIPNADINIPPMLMLPFIENAFKHGSALDGIMKVDISINISDNILYFNIKNTFIQKDSTEGIGLVNIIERLNILYESSYKLSIITEQSWYIVSLRINL